MQLVKEIYLLTKMLPKDEVYGLSSQMRRAAVSIPSNIAEGQERNSTKEFINFLSIARGSKAELETQLEICIEIGYFTMLDAENAFSLSDEISKILSSLTQKLVASG